MKSSVTMRVKQSALLLLLASPVWSAALATPMLTVDPSNAFGTPGGDPRLRSESVLILDGAGRVVYSKDSAIVRPIASLTKLMTAIVILDSQLDLDARLEVTRVDRDLVKLTGSRLEYGARLSRREMLQLALMASENRAAAVLGRTYPGGTAAFVAAMNRKSEELGMADTRFVDPVGLSPDNVSTAQDMAKLLAAAAEFPEIAASSTALSDQVYPYPGRGPLNYVNTNRLLKNPNWDISVSKTGYINEAGRCLVMLARLGEENLSIVLLDSFGKLTPFGDSNRLRRWLLSR